MKFKIALISFLSSAILLALLCYFYQWSYWLLLFPFLVFKLILIYGSSVIQSNFYLNAFNSGKGNVKEIAITFDDGPHSIYTPKVLEVLKAFNASATFFVIGKNTQGNEAVLKNIHEQGHLIGNHSYSHSFFIDFKSTNGFVDEINQTAQKIKNITEQSPLLFRPPYGVTTPHIAKAVKRLNLSVIGWNIRSFDTTNDSEQVITERVKNQIKPGSIILFHDTSDKTISVLKQTLNFAKENGFKVVSLEHLLNIKAYA